MAGVTANLPLANGLQPLSCLRCAKRKVRCDRLVPCSNCTRHAATCDFPQPRAEKRQKKRAAASPPFSTISSSCHGGDVQALEAGGRPFDTPVSLWEAPRTRRTGGSKTPRGAPCPFSDATRSESEAAEAVQQLHGFPFPLLSATASPMDALESSRQHLAPLWRIYRSHIHPLTMILHAPTAGQLLTKAASPQHFPSPDMQALLFATMACSLISISDGECAKLLGKERSALFTTYRAGCEAALVQAQMFTSSSLVVLQALTIYLVAIAPYTDPCELWNLIGIAKRNAKRLGYDRRRPETGGAEPFHYEMHRRLWLNLVVMDDMAAQSAGLAHLASLDDVCLPANLDDVDVVETMQKVPDERPGATDMLFCLLRFDVSRIMSNVHAGKKPWILPTGNVVVDQALCAERAQALAQMEKELELKFLRYCDMLDPVHFLAALTARWALCQLRFTSMRLDPYDLGPPACPEQKKQVMFSTALKVVEYENSVHRQSSAHGFVWHRIPHGQWQCLTHVLESLGAGAGAGARACTNEEMAEKAWEQIDIFYEFHPQLYRSPGPPADPLHRRINQLVLVAWVSRQSSDMRTTPEYMAVLLQDGQESHVMNQPALLTHSSQSLDIHADSSRMSGGRASKAAAAAAASAASINWVDWDSLIDADTSASPHGPDPHLDENLCDFGLMLDTSDPTS